MNVDDQLSAILKERAPHVLPNPQAWDRISNAPRNNTRWYAGAAAAAVAVVALGSVAVVLPNGDRRRGGPSATPPAATSATDRPAGSDISGRAVYGTKDVVRVVTFSRDAGEWSSSGTDVARDPTKAGINDVEVTADGTAVFAAGFTACASGIYSAPLTGGNVTTLVAPRTGVSLFMPTVNDGRLAFVRGACTKGLHTDRPVPGASPPPDGPTMRLRRERLVVRDLATGAERVIGSVDGAGVAGLSWADGRYLAFVTHNPTSSLVAYDTTKNQIALTAPAAAGCHWGSLAGRSHDAEIAAVEVCADGTRSRVSTFTIRGDRLERGNELFAVPGDVGSLDYDATGTRLLFTADRQVTMRDADGTITRLQLDLGTDRPLLVW